MRIPPHIMFMYKKQGSPSDVVGKAPVSGGDLLSRLCAVPSARAGLTSLFGMGRGVTPPP